MKAFQLAILALSPLFVSFESAHAQAALCGNPCGKGYTYSCSDTACRCIPKTSTYWFVSTTSSTAPGSLTDKPRSDAYECVPELHQCGCNGVLDCFNMFLNLKVKCEWFGCNDLGCVCHFPNSIPN